MASHVKIECPCCGWEPDGGAHWMCSCGCVWNTFDTAARCPNCGKQWEYTACIPYMGGCHAMPPHADWYKGLDDWLEDELSDVEESIPAVALLRKERTLEKSITVSTQGAACAAGLAYPYRSTISYAFRR